LTEFAWNLKSFQISGGPGWALHGPLASSELYQVIAKADGTRSADDFRVMLQALLADRFRLQIRHVDKSVPVYELVVAKTGAKLAVSQDSQTPSLAVDSSKKYVTHITARHTSIRSVLGLFERAAGRPVRDATGLTGFYDFEVGWAPDGVQTPDVDTTVDAPSLFTALQSQLGLQLKSATGQFDTVIIDRADKPSEN
jgi:uncharacterized protein (TIGR03435 family)